MNIECTVSIQFESKTQAQHVLKSIQLDDQGYIHSRVEGKMLQATISAVSMPSLLHTLDDYLACVTVAEGIIKKK